MRRELIQLTCEHNFRRYTLSDKVFTTNTSTESVTIVSNPGLFVAYFRSFHNQITNIV